ncbi:MAG: hypothetical protein LUQ31_06355 [Methanoregula sp.]|nr:hypothetical protein [Methanoregula sp.]
MARLKFELILQNSGLPAASKNRGDGMVVLGEFGGLKGIGGPFFQDLNPGKI